MIDAPSFRSGRALLTVKARPFVLTAKPCRSFPPSSGQAAGLRRCRPGEQDIDLALLFGHLRIEPVQIGEVRYVSLHCNDTAANQRYRLVQFRLAAPDDVDECAFINERLAVARPCRYRPQ